MNELTWDPMYLLYCSDLLLGSYLGEVADTWGRRGVGRSCRKAAHQKRRENIMHMWELTTLSSQCCAAGCKPFIAEIDTFCCSEYSSVVGFYF